MNEEREPIIDALLEEVLGGVTPPDLTERILRAHETQDESSIDVRVGLGGSDTTPEAIPQIKTSRRKAVRTGRAGKGRATNWNFWASAAVVLVGASIAGYFGLKITNDTRLANLPPETTEQHPPAPEDIVSLPPPIVVDNNPPTDTESNADPATPSPEAIVGTEGEPALEPLGRGIQTESPVFEREIELGEPEKANRVVAFINRELKNKWEAESVSPTGAISDAAWLFRASNFLAGRKPTPAEQQQLARSRDREEVIASLLASDDFANHWSSVLTSVLIDSGRKRNVDAQALERWLADSVRSEKPYDQIAFELMTAVGSNRSEADDYNPATNFLLAHQRVARDEKGKAEREKKVAAVNKVCQVFLGMQMQCAQCHDHQGTTQQQYYEVASFMTQMQSVNPAEAGGVARLVNVDVTGSDGSKSEADLFFHRPNATGVSVYPRFLDGRTLATTSGSVDAVDRRAEMAKMIVSSPNFAKATMNRLWDKAFGSGFTTPVDDIGSHNPATHPKLLEKLATEFRNHEFNLKSALKWIAMSSAFDRRERSINSPISSGKNEYFASFSRQDGETYKGIGSTLEKVARQLKKNSRFGAQEIYAQIGQDGKTSPEKRQREERRINRMLQETLLRTDKGSLISRLASNENLSDQQRIGHLFLSTVGRPPNNYELNKARELLKNSTSSVVARQNALKRIGWVLLNSEEFRTQH